MKLYFNKFSRATRPRWLLEELGVPYEVVPVDMRAGEHKRPEYLRVHPLGKVPALEFDGHTMIESAAIILHLADLYPEKGLAPAPGTPERARYYEAILFAMTTIEPAIVDLAAHGAASPKPAEERNAATAEAAKRSLAASLPVVEGWLGAGPWLLGETLSGADVVLGSLLAWGERLGALEGHPALHDYVGRCVARPGFKAARKD